MPPRCSVCTHFRRAAIDAALATGTALRDIAGQFGASKTALHRHREHAGAAIGKAAERRGERIADSTLDRLEAIQRKLWALLTRMEAAGDLRGAVGALREARELVAAIDDVVARAKPAGEAERERVLPEARHAAIADALLDFGLSAPLVAQIRAELDAWQPPGLHAAMRQSPSSWSDAVARPPRPRP